MYSFDAILPGSNIRREWLQNAVITNRKAFTELPADLADFGILLPEASHSDEWLRYRHKNEDYIVLSKAAGAVRSFSPLACQKIAADLASLFGLPVPAGTLWNRKNNGRFISPLAFPHSLSEPPNEVLKADKFFPAMAIFDWYIENEDRSLPNVVWNAAGSVEDSQIIYIDHAIAARKRISEEILGSPEKRISQRMADSTVNFLRGHWFRAEDCHDELVDFALSQIPSSSIAQRLITDIEQLPSQTLRKIIYRIPNNFFYQGHVEKVEILESLSIKSHHVRHAFKQATFG
jgi:hypothetical protein